jgi:hypothetical protein
MVQASEKAAYGVDVFQSTKMTAFM